MGHRHYFFNRYFWLANVSFWLALHGLLVHVQYGAANSVGSDLSWIRTWVLMSPWYLSWIWVTAGIFFMLWYNEKNHLSLFKRTFNHGLCMTVLLICYWSFCSGARILIRGEELSEFWAVLTRILTTSSQLDVAIYLAILTAGLSIHFYHKAIKNANELKHLHHELIQEQLKTLRSQLNPHFLFNALNTVASLVRLKREKDAVFALSELSLMLRKILERRDDQNVKIKDEITFINSYLSIQKMRFLDKLDTHISVQPDCLELKIPNMILHPLVENAVQHGSQLESNKNPLNLEILRDKNEIKLLITNKVAKDDVHNGFGIGLTNTRERLSKIYPHFRLELHPLKNNLFETLLVIPIGERDA
jgi:LytS/YehU family sensor histidine kinase